MVKHQDVILGPYFFLCDRFSVLYSPCAKIKKKKEKRKPDLPVKALTLHPTPFGLMAARYLRDRIM